MAEVYFLLIVALTIFLGLCLHNAYGQISDLEEECDELERIAYKEREKRQQLERQLRRVG